MRSVRSVWGQRSANAMTEDPARPPMTDASAPAGPFARLAPFPRTFWVINVIELFERGAFYGVLAVLAVYLTLVRGIDAAVVGAALASLFWLNYTVPLVSAPFSEKYGYRGALVVSFALVLAGYATLGLADGGLAVWGGVLLVGFGAGVFKPLAAALVGQTTTDETRTFGFGVYYAFVNIGGFLFPLAIALVGVARPDLLYATAFAVGSALALLNVALSAFVFRNLTPPQRDVRVLAALRSLLDVVREWRLGVLVAVYTGFWIMYAMNQSWLPVYMVEFGRVPAWFNAAFLVPLNSLVVIVGALVVGKMLQGRDPLKAMVAGIALYVAGFAIMGFSSTPAFFLAGVVVFAVGEVVTHPSYLAYVAGIAPKGKESVYLGFAFLAIGLGYTIGTAGGGVLYADLAQDSARPATFWAAMASVGVVTVALLVLYNRFVAPGRRAAAGPAARLAAPVAAALALIVIPGLFVAAASIDQAPVVLPGPGTPAVAGPFEDETAEGATTAVAVVLDPGASGEAIFVLGWSDEPPQPGAANAPDTFALRATGPDGLVHESEATNPPGGRGEIALAVPAAAGEWTVEVEAVACGDETVTVGPLSVPGSGRADGGNAWTLEARYSRT